MHVKCICTINIIPNASEYARKCSTLGVSKCSSPHCCWIIIQEKFVKLFEILIVYCYPKATEYEFQLVQLR